MYRALAPVACRKHACLSRHGEQYHWYELLLHDVVSCKIALRYRVVGWSYAAASNLYCRAQQPLTPAGVTKIWQTPLQLCKLVPCAMPSHDICATLCWCSPPVPRVLPSLYASFTLQSVRFLHTLQLHAGAEHTSMTFVW